MGVRQAKEDEIHIGVSFLGVKPRHALGLRKMVGLDLDSLTGRFPFREVVVSDNAKAPGSLDTLEKERARADELAAELLNTKDALEKEREAAVSAGRIVAELRKTVAALEEKAAKPTPTAVPTAVPSKPGLLRGRGKGKREEDADA
jgi:hypothetical protein